MSGKGDKIRKGANLQAYWNNFDSIFRKPKNEVREEIVSNDKVDEKTEVVEKPVDLDKN